MAVSFAVLPMSAFFFNGPWNGGFPEQRHHPSLISSNAINTTNGNNGIAYFDATTALAASFLSCFFWGRYRMMYMNTRIRTIGRKVTSRLAVLKYQRSKIRS